MMLRCLWGNTRKFKSCPLEGTENDSTQLLMNSSVSRVFPPFSGTSASKNNRESEHNHKNNLWFKNKKEKTKLHTYYIRQRRFSNWSLQTNTIIIPVEFAEVVQKSIENLDQRAKCSLLKGCIASIMWCRFSLLSFSSKSMIQVYLMENLLLVDHLRIHEIDGKYTEQVFPEHMLKSDHGEHPEYDSRSSTKLLSE